MLDPDDDLLQFERVLTRATPLSPAGNARRQTMRDTLLARVTQQRRVRLALRTATGAAVVAAALWLVPRPQPIGAPAAPPALQLAHADFAIVTDARARVADWRATNTFRDEVLVRGDRPLRHVDYAVAHVDATTVAAMLAPRRSLPPETSIGDDEVLRLLAAADRPTGLVRSPAGVFFTRDVFDARPNSDE